jgi:hypothetical protein
LVAGQHFQIAISIQPPLLVLRRAEQQSLTNNRKQNVPVVGGGPAQSFAQHQQRHQTPTTAGELGISHAYSGLRLLEDIGSLVAAQHKALRNTNNGTKHQQRQEIKVK